MKARRRNGRLFFNLDRRQWRMFQAVLSFYPRIPEAHQKLSKADPQTDNEANQALLNEALNEQRAENKRQLEMWLKDPERFMERPGGCKIRLFLSEVESLMQILNDVRVGSWIAAGSPDYHQGPIELNPENGPALWVMEMAGYFQMALLEGLHPKKPARKPGPKKKPGE